MGSTGRAEGCSQKFAVVVVLAAVSERETFLYLFTKLAIECSGHGNAKTIP